MTAPPLPAPRRLGHFLGVEPRAGGMFQYAQSVLEALSRLEPQRYTITIAYSDVDWSPILARFGLRGHALRYGKFGQRMADIAMVLRIPGAASRMFGRFANPLVRELLAQQCDAWLFPAQESLSYQMPGCVIGTIHDLMHRYEPTFPEVSSKFRFGIREHRFSNIARNSTAVLVDSNVGRQHVVESYGIAPFKVHPLPYVAPSYLNDAREPDNFDVRYGLPAKFLFYPAQFWPHKNHMRLLEAMHRVAEMYPDIALVLSGGHSHAFEQVQQHAQALGLGERVRFVGYVPDSDLRSFYVRARALIMPTFFGPTNIPPLEAMTTGCPAIVSGIYGMPEQSGDAALYFDPHSVDEIAERISQVWCDDRLAEEMALKGLDRSRAHGQTEFNQRLADILDIVYEQLPT